MAAENSSKTLLFAFTVCLVASIVVSTIAVLLRPSQERNRALDRQKNILFAAGLLNEGETASAEQIEEMFATIRVKAVDIATGNVIEDFDAQNYDQKRASKDAAASEVISADKDIALIKRREKVGLLYELVDANGGLQRLIVPIKGYGLWSTMYGFIALSGDGSKVEGITFYEHAETPGLGGEVDNPAWKASWKGKVPYGDNGEVLLTVVKGKAPDNEAAKIDGLSGATITSRGVDNLIKYWLGEEGYGKYIKKNVLVGL